MPRIVTFLSGDTIQNLKEISRSSGKTVSKISAELIEIGYKIKHHQETQQINSQDKKQELVDKHTEYLLRLIALTTDIYRCVRNEKSQYEEGNVADVLKTVKADISKEIDGYLKKKISVIPE